MPEEEIIEMAVEMFAFVGGFIFWYVGSPFFLLSRQDKQKIRKAQDLSLVKKWSLRNELARTKMPSIVYFSFWYTFLRFFAVLLTIAGSCNLATKHPLLLPLGILIIVITILLLAWINQALPT